MSGEENGGFTRALRAAWPPRSLTLALAVDPAVIVLGGGVARGRAAAPGVAAVHGRHRAPRGDRRRRMTALLIAGGAVVGAAGVAPADVLVVDGAIVAVGPSLSAPDGAVVVPADGLFVAPGFIDLQLNGAHGIDLTEEPERLWEVAALLPRYGVTGFLPTIVTSPPEVVDRAMAALAVAPGGVRRRRAPRPAPRRPDAEP